MRTINNKGQALVEYVVIVGLVSILIVGLVSYFGGYLKDALTKASCPLVGEEYVPGEKRGEGTCSAKNKVTSPNDLEDLFK